MNKKRMTNLARTNIFLAIILNILTCSIYSVYWLHQKTLFLNKEARHEKIPVILVWICYGLLIIAFSNFLPHSLFYLYFVFKILLIFAIRKEIHSYCDISPKSKYWLNAIYSFLFGFLYLVYKIDSFYSNKSTPTNQHHTA